jgi:hypothetical protein
MTKTAEVERWFESTKPPAEKAIRRLRDLILAADRRMTEYVKYGTVMFAFNGDMAGLVKFGKPGVNLMFMRGSLLQGRYPHLEGTGRAVRFLRFAEKKDVDAASAEIRAIVREWCAVRGPTSAKTKPTSRSRR